MSRLLRITSVFLVAAALASLAASCSYVEPPAMTMADSPNATPFFTMTRQELFAEADKQAKAQGASGRATTTTTAYSTSTLADVLSATVFRELQKHEIAQANVVVTDADRQFAEASSQQSGTGAAADQLEQQAQFVALARTKGEQLVADGTIDQDKLARELYESRKQQLTTPAQVCLHAIEILALDEQTAASQNAQPTAAQMAAAQATAQAARNRIGAETFETVADDVIKQQPQLQQYPPGGNIGCVSEEQLPPAAIAAMKDLAVGAVSDPVALDASYAIIQIDERKPESVRTFESVKDQAYQQVLLQEGAKVIGQLQKEQLLKIAIVVDPQFGVWSAKDQAVLPPPGASEPTIPTTSTTLLDPSTIGLTPRPTTAASGAGSTTTTPPTTSGTATPGASTTTTVPGATTTTVAGATTSTVAGTASSTTSTAPGASTTSTAPAASTTTASSAP